MTNLTDLLQPLADATVPCPDLAKEGHPRSGCMRCTDGKAPDPRFSAISGGHYHHGQGGVFDEISCAEAYCEGHAEVRTDLGSLVRAADACGDETFALVVHGLNLWHWNVHNAVVRDTPEEAASRALLAAVEEG